MSVRVVLLGAPGSGKGTQGKRLAEHFEIPHISTGDLIRDQIARRTDFGRKVEAAIAGGNFAPDSDMVALVAQRLKESDAEAGYVLDGFPRDVAQAVLFGALLGNGERGIVVIELAVSPEAVIERVAGRLVCPHCDAVYHLKFCPPQESGLCDLDGAQLVRRPDDEPEAVRHRLEVYETLTLPLRQHYEDCGLLRTVDAEGAPDVVFERILLALSQNSAA